MVTVRKGWARERSYELCESPQSERSASNPAWVSLKLNHCEEPTQTPVQCVSKPAAHPMTSGPCCILRVSRQKKHLRTISHVLWSVSMICSDSVISLRVLRQMHNEQVSSSKCQWHAWCIVGFQVIIRDRKPLLGQEITSKHFPWAHPSCSSSSW